MIDSNNLVIEIVGFLIGVILAYALKKNKIISLISYVMIGWFGMGIILYFF